MKQEDVLHLVEISDDIRRKRSKIHIDIERNRSVRPSSGYKDDYYEREVTYDSRRSRYR